MANTFLYAQGHDVGGSMCEPDLADTAREIIRLAGQNNCKLFLPLDIVVAEKLVPGAAVRVRGVGQVDEDERIFDAGPETVERLKRALANSKTLIWNGPLGVFEVPPYDKATVETAKEAAKLCREGKLVAVAGGGDTVAALNAAGVTQDFSFVSTAGGAFLEWMEGKTLPGVAALEGSQG
jgi:phosphoglycerate kinase